MPIQGICVCDVAGCTTRPMTGGTTLLLEADAVFAGWEVCGALVRCPACVRAERWPDATMVPAAAGAAAPDDPTEGETD